MYDFDEDGDHRTVNVEGQAETVTEVLELFLPFMKGCTYYYVNQMVAVYDDGKEVGTST
jgi:hypothetical protein